MAIKPISINQEYLDWLIENYPEFRKGNFSKAVVKLLQTNFSPNINGLEKQKIAQAKKIAELKQVRDEADAKHKIALKYMQFLESEEKRKKAKK